MNQCFKSNILIELYSIKHTCDNLMMAMTEICCSDEGDQGLNGVP